MLQEGTGLNKQGLLLFTKIKSKLNIPTKRKFNLQSDKRTGLQGDWAAWKLSDDNCLGKAGLRYLPTDRSNCWNCCITPKMTAN